MKTIVTLLVSVLICSACAHAQSANKKYVYAFVFLEEPEAKESKLVIDYGNGREENFAELKKFELEKNRRNTNHVVDAFNYMDEQGYEYVNCLTSYRGGGWYGEKYVFRKEARTR